MWQYDCVFLEDCSFHTNKESISGCRLWNKDTEDKIFIVCMCEKNWWPINLDQGSQPLEIRENLENEFPIFQSGKTQGIWGKHKKVRENSGNLGKTQKSQGKLREFVTVTQKGKDFASLGYVRLVPCVHWLTGYSGFCEYYTTLQTITVGAARTTSWLPSNLIKGKIFLMEFWNFLREISGKTRGISFP